MTIISPPYKNVIIALLFFLYASESYCQIGIRAQYHIQSSSTLDALFQDNNSYWNNEYSIGVDYWKRLKNYRIEFYPTVDLRITSSATGLELNTIKKKAIGFTLNTHIYPFDFKEDCDCPTFSKDGNFLTKGFFLLLNPGIAYNGYSSDLVSVKDKGFSYHLGIGGGIDIGITDVITITPYLGYARSFNHNWPSLNEQLLSPSQSFSLGGIFTGIRTGLRIDYANNRRFR